MARNQRDSIPIQNVEKARDILKAMADAMEDAASQCREAKMESVMIEGWETLHRGLGYTINQVRKLAGPASAVQAIDVDAILTPTQMAKKKAKAKEDAADDATLRAAEAKATYKPKGKPKRRSP